MPTDVIHSVRVSPQEAAALVEFFEQQGYSAGGVSSMLRDILRSLPTMKTWKDETVQASLAFCVSRGVNIMHSKQNRQRILRGLSVEADRQAELEMLAAATGSTSLDMSKARDPSKSDASKDLPLEATPDPNALEEL